MIETGGAKVQVTGYRSQVTDYRSQVTGHNKKNTCGFAVSSYLVCILYSYTNPTMSYFSKIPTSLRIQSVKSAFIKSFFSPTCSSNNALLMVYWDVTSGL